MSKQTSPAAVDLTKLDRIYREGGLKNMASPHVHYQQPECPHAGCDHKMEWIDFRLELFDDVDNIYKPLVRAWWDGTGFAGRCPKCDGWIHFTTMELTAASYEEAKPLPKLPEQWHSTAQFA